MSCSLDKNFHKQLKYLLTKILRYIFFFIVASLLS